MDPLAAIKVTFFQECEEQLGELESGLLAMQTGSAEPDTVHAVFRAVHSIKGGAGAFGLDDLVRFSHGFETVLDEVRSDRIPASAAVVAALLTSADVLADLVRAARDGVEVEPARVLAAAVQLEQLCPGATPPIEADQADDDFGFQPMALDFTPFADEPEPAAEAPAVPVYTVVFKPHAALYANANETGLILRELARLGEAEIGLDDRALPTLDALVPEAAYLSWTIRLATEAGEDAIREVFEWVDGDCDLTITVEAEAGTGAEEGEDIAALLARLETEVAAAASPPPQVAAPEPEPSAAPVAVQGVAVQDIAVQGVAVQGVAPAVAAPGHPANDSAPAGATIRVDLERVDKLIDLVGELVIHQAVLSQRATENGLAKSASAIQGLDDLERLTRELQDSVMAIRAQPVKSVFSRMPRLVREVAAQVGKQVRLVTEGESTEVDKTVIERLGDPLVHMIRNAVDHGLEKTADRLAAGKPAEGTVRLSASHRSGRIVIEVRDDGAGVNRPRVKAKAVERGLIAADAVLTDEEVDNLIFLPGFSTAETLSDISGRGVGMDVVKRSVQALGGRIAITSRPGEGSTFTLSLPLTLAVLDGMVVEAGGQTLVAPLTCILETLKPKPQDVRALGSGAPLLASRGGFIPLIDVGQVLGFRREPLSAADGVVLLVETDGGRRAALLVEHIHGQRQVVIKSLEANYRPVPGVAAATILGDGRVALILDADALSDPRALPQPHRERTSAAQPTDLQRLAG